MSAPPGVTRTCPVCGENADAGSRFCEACGAVLDDGASPGPTAGDAAAPAAVAVLVLGAGWVAVLGRAAATGGARLVADVVPAVLPLGVFAVVRLLAGDGGSAAGAIALSVGCGAAACVLGAAVWPRAWGLLPGLGAIARRSPMARTV